MNNNAQINKMQAYWGGAYQESQDKKAPAVREVIKERPPEIVLSKRLTSVAELLSLGLCRKEIASDLGLSIHTINGYVKQLYLTFGVNSHVEFVLAYKEHSV